MLRLYNVESKYVKKLHDIDNKVEYHHGEHNKPYLGIIMTINSINYFVPLSSPKPKHKSMHESLTLIKIKNKKGLLAVLNINNMIPVPLSLCKKIDIKKISDNKYKNLLNNEYFICKRREKKIKKSASLVHKFICDEPEKNKNIVGICCNFVALEDYYSSINH